MDQQIVYSRFFELLRIACGTQTSLSRHLVEEEWRAMYLMARKQSMVGISFAGIQALNSAYCPSKEMCREWMKNAEPIRKQNRLVSSRAAELCLKLSENGFHPTILKGQSFAPYYGDLAEYRNPGDIDVWVDKPIDEIDDYVRSLGVRRHTTVVHVECSIFPDVPVELHPQPAVIRCPWLNKRFKQWYESFDVESFEKYNGCAVAPLAFNLVYLLVHIQHHLLFEGIGLRQYMDYFFVLKSADTHKVKEQFNKTISSLQMVKLARGVMWIMQDVFGIDADHLLIEPDAKVGRLLLDEAMSGGNFGKYDTRNRMVRSHNPLARAWGGIVRNARFFSIAPEIVICNPFWRIWHYLWRKINIR